MENDDPRQDCAAIWAELLNLLSAFRLTSRRAARTLAATTTRRSVSTIWGMSVPRTALLLPRRDQSSRRLADRANAPPAARQRRGDARPSTTAPTKAAPTAVLPLLLVAIAMVLLTAFRWRHAGYIEAEAGLGYWLGIAGASMLLLVLAYPLRKRSRWLRGAGRVASWFRLHMLLGLVAPTLILLHSNFQLGATNSAVALVSLLTVAASGLAGRYLYRKIHLGLYGARARASDLLAGAEAARQRLGLDLASNDDVWADLAAYEADFLRPARGRGPAGPGAAPGRRRTPRRRRLIKEVDTAVARQGRQLAWPAPTTRGHRVDARRQLKAYFAALDQAARLAVYERLFSYWHVLHVPLFLLLIVAVVIHVIAVHLY